MTTVIIEIDFIGYEPKDEKEKAGFLAAATLLTKSITVEFKKRVDYDVKSTCYLK